MRVTLSGLRVATGRRVGAALLYLGSLAACAQTPLVTQPDATAERPFAAPPRVTRCGGIAALAHPRADVGEPPPSVSGALARCDGSGRPLPR